MLVNGSRTTVFPIQAPAQQPFQCTSLSDAQDHLKTAKNALKAAAIRNLPGQFARINQDVAVPLGGAPTKTELVYDRNVLAIRDLDQDAGLTVLGAHVIKIKTAAQDTSWSFRIDEWDARQVSVGVAGVAISPSGKQFIVLESVKHVPIDGPTEEIRLLGHWQWTNGAWQLLSR